MHDTIEFLVGKIVDLGQKTDELGCAERAPQIMQMQVDALGKSLQGLKGDIREILEEVQRTKDPS